MHRAALAAHQRALLADELEEHGLHRDAAGERVVVAAVGAEGPVVVAHRGGEAGGHRLLADPEVRRPAHQPGQEELVGALLEEAAGEHRAVHPQTQVAVEVCRAPRRPHRSGQYAFATKSSCDGKRVITCGSPAVMTTSSSIRAAE